MAGYIRHDTFYPGHLTCVHAGPFRPGAKLVVPVVVPNSSNVLPVNLHKQSCHSCRLSDLSKTVLGVAYAKTIPPAILCRYGRSVVTSGGV